MAYSQTLIDDFNDNSIDLAKWTLTDGAGITESGGKLNVPALAAYPQAQSQAIHNLENGILAIKLTKSGTPTNETEYYFGAHDGVGNSVIAMLGTPFTNFYSFATDGAVTIADEVYTDTIGIGPGWVNDTWLGIGNLGSDNILRLYKSTTGSSWTEMARCTVTGSFNKATTGLDITCGVYSGSTSWVANIEDASFWVETASTAKVRVGGVWVAANPKVRVGGAWVSATPKVRVGGAWVIP